MNRTVRAGLTIRAAFADALRSARRRPGMFALGALSLAIALGLATAVLAQIDSLMHPRTPVLEPTRAFRATFFLDTRRVTSTQQVVDAMLMSPTIARVVPTEGEYGAIETGARYAYSRVMMAPPALFELLGVTPTLGRMFRPDETYHSGVALVTEELWKQWYQGRPSLDSATLRFGDRQFTIIGVLPRNLVEVLDGAIVLPPRPSTRVAPNYFFRTAPTADSAATYAALEGVTRHLYTTYGGTGRKWYAYARTLRPDPIEINKLYGAMMGAAVLILVIACANVSALMLTRAVTQRRDQALRLAIGASRTTLFAGVAAEAALIATVGGVAGAIIAHWTMKLVVATTPVQMRWFGFLDPRWSPRVFALLFGVIAFTVALAALAPAWFTTRIAPAEPLKDSSGTTTGRPAHHFKVVVAAELALSMILLLAGSLIAKSVLRIESYDFGYDARGVLFATANMSVRRTLPPPPPPPLTARDSARVDPRWRRAEITYETLAGMIARIRALPDVANAVWFTQTGALNGVASSTAPTMADSAVRVNTVYNVGPDFFRTLGIAIIAGRDFDEGDRFGVGTAILDSSGAARLFPNGNAIGGEIKLGPATSSLPWLRVVGIARNAVHSLPEHAELDPDIGVYITRADSMPIVPIFLARPARASPEVAPAMVRAIRDVLPPATSVSAGPWLSTYEARLVPRRYLAATFAVLSLASLALATAGLFGVLAYVVGQRMREFAVRIALGATKRDVMRLVLRDGLAMALAGTGIGAVIAMYAGFTMWDWLWGVYPVDAVALIAAELVLLTVTMAASAVPALRAARADPVEVMRSM